MQDIKIIEEVWLGGVRKGGGGGGGGVGGGGGGASRSV